jgi:hypothetical protein
MHTQQRRATVLLAAVLAASLAPVLGAIGASATVCASGAISAGPHGWTEVAAPAFGTGGKQLTAYAVRADRAKELYATNGVAIARSRDSGCTWSDVYAVQATPSLTTPLSSATSTVTALYAPGRGTDVYAVAADGPRVHILRSADGGTTWTVTGVGPVQAGTAAGSELLVPPAGPLYLVTGKAGTTRLVYTSDDRGATWQLSDLPAALLAAAPDALPRLNDLAVSPADPLRMFAATSVGLFGSSDGGATWRPAGIGGGSALDSVTAGRSPDGVSVVAVDDADLVGYVSADGGSTWTAVNVPGAVDAAALNPRQSTAVVSSAQGVYQVRLADAGLTPMWRDAPRLSAVTIDADVTPYVYACSCGDEQPAAIWRRHDIAPGGDVAFVPPPPPIVIPGIADDDYQCLGDLPQVDAPKPQAPSTLSPGTRRITLEPGQSVTVPYVLHAAPRRFDVYYLTESGAKMEYALCAVGTGAVLSANALSAERDLRAGLGDYRDYPGQTDEEWGDGGPDGSGFTYLRRAGVGPANDTLPRTLPDLHWRLGPDGAGGAAVYQAVTGVGQDLAPTGPSLYDILGGQQASFGSDSFKVVLLSTGKWLNDPQRTAGYPGVPLDTVVETLKKRDVKLVGIWINNTGNKQSQGNQRFEGRMDVRRLATESGAVAGTTIDCNDDGYTDLERGDPLVCDWLAIDSENGAAQRYGDPSMGSAMTRLLRDLRDPQDVTLVATRGATAVTGVAPPSYGAVDLLRENTHDFAVTFSCGAGQVNETVPISLAGVAGPTTVAQADVLLQCGHAVPVAHHPAALVVPPPVVPPVPNPLPNPGPGPVAQAVPNAVPNPAPAAQAQAQAQPVAQGAVVPQEQAQPQLAFQRANNALQGEEAMNALPEERDPLAAARRLALFDGACVVALAGALRLAPARAEERRRRR